MDVTEPSDFQKMEWLPFSGPLLFGFHKDPVWVKLTLQNPTIQKYLYLENPVAYVDEITIYRWNGKEFKTISDGDKYPARTLVLPTHPYALFRLTSEVPNSKGEIYLRYHSISSLFILPKLYYPDGFVFEQLSVSQWYFIYFAIILFVFLLNVVFYFNTRNSSFLFYCFYVFCAALYQIVHNGFGKVYLWPNSGTWNDRSLVFFGSLALVSVVFFSIRFLSIHKKMKRTFFVLKGLLFLILLNAILSLVFRSVYTVQTIHGIGIITSLFLLGVGLYSWSKNNRIARYYILAWTVLFIFILLFNLYAFGLLPDHFFFRHSIEIGTILEIFLFHLAVVDRIRGWEEPPQIEEPQEPEASELSEPVVSSEPQTKKSTSVLRLSGVDPQAKIAEMNQIMESEKLFCDEDLDLLKMAEILELRADQVSALLNQYVGQSFNQYINRFRIEEARKMMVAEPDRNILSIAFAVGFNSKSTFYDAFQKIVGITPKEFKKSPDS
jgi:AraC-like DNA-binding protein